MFQLIDNTLCIKAKALYQDLELMTYDNYLQQCCRGKLKKVVRGGNGREAMIAYGNMPDELKFQIKKIINGKNPFEYMKENEIKKLIEQDLKAIKFFDEYIKPDGYPLTPEKKREYMANANVLNAIGAFIKDKSGWRKSFGGKKLNMWETLSAAVNEIYSDEIPHSLPTKPRPLRNKYTAYKKGGYASLVHGGTGNINTQKLSEVAKAWLLARWASPVERLTMTQLWEEFNALSDKRGWKPLDDQKTIRNYLYRPEIKEQWWGYRYGELKAKEKYAYQHSTILPSMRDELWYSDGTKLNLYYMEDGKMQTTSVYEVMDAYSEVFLGFHISKKEDFAAQFGAFKMAVQTAGHRPYECRYDNQGGHKKLQNSDFLTKLSHLSIRTQPYNGKSKTIEAAFGRFQQQVMHKLWYFTGQNVQAKKEESKANMEFILANTDNLPSYDEAVKAYILCRNEWNNGTHPVTGKTRMQTYLGSENPKAPEIGFFDMVDLFWLTKEKAITYKAYGLTMEVKGMKHTYAMYDADRNPDIKWHRKNIDRKFAVKYDPEDLSTICIYAETPAGLQYAGTLMQKIKVHRGKQEADPFEASFLAQVNNANKAARIDTRDNIEKILEEQGLHPKQHGLNTAPLKGIEKSPKRKKKQAETVDIGEYQKNISNMDAADLEDAEYMRKKLF